MARQVILLVVMYAYTTTTTTTLSNMNHGSYTPVYRLPVTCNFSLQHMSLILNIHVLVNWHLLIKNKVSADRVSYGHNDIYCGLKFRTCWGHMFFCFVFFLFLKLITAQVLFFCFRLVVSSQVNRTHRLFRSQLTLTQD